LQEELKTIQNESRKNRYSKSDELQLRKAIDSAFQYLNEQRHHFFSDKNAMRIKGLNEVIDKMEQSLARDRKDLDYMLKKSESNKVSSLEMQLLKVKGNMLNETIASKEEKLKDIRSTLESVLKQTGKSTKQKSVTDEGKPDTAEGTPHSDIPNPSPGE
jgi:uncharacterized coiled-coil protein SlyX